MTKTTQPWLTHLLPTAPRGKQSRRRDRAQSPSSRSGFRGYGVPEVPAGDPVFVPWDQFDDVPVYAGNLALVRFYASWLPSQYLSPERKGWMPHMRVKGVWTHAAWPDLFLHRSWERYGWVLGQRVKSAPAPGALDDAARRLFDAERQPTSEILLPLRLRIPVCGGYERSQRYRTCSLQPVTDAPWFSFRHRGVPFEVRLVASSDGLGSVQLWAQAFVGQLYTNSSGAVRSKLQLPDGRWLAGHHQSEVEGILDDCANMLVWFVDKIHHRKRSVPMRQGGTAEPVLGRLHFDRTAGLALPVQLPGEESFTIWMARGAAKLSA